MKYVVIAFILALTNRIYRPGVQQPNKPNLDNKVYMQSKTIGLMLLLLVCFSATNASATRDYSLVNIESLCLGQLQQDNSGDNGYQLAQRGCCSHHRGVCGCSDDGRAICCDNTYSPSCGCWFYYQCTIYDAVNDILTHLLAHHTANHPFDISLYFYHNR